MLRTYEGWKIVTRDIEFWIYPPGETWASDVLPTLQEAKALIDRTLKPIVVYGTFNEDTGIKALVATAGNAFNVTVHDVDEGEIVGTRSFEHRADAEAYADCCTFS